MGEDEVLFLSFFHPWMGRLTICACKRSPKTLKFANKYVIINDYFVIGLYMYML